jgi:hypothetical protein
MAAKIRKKRKNQKGANESIFCESSTENPMIA